MMVVRQPICLRRSGPGRYYWQIALTTATVCAKASKNEEHGLHPPHAKPCEYPAFSPWLYQQRNAVERFFNKLKHFRAIATRYDKRDDNFLAFIQLAAIRIWLRSYESVT